MKLAVKSLCGVLFGLVCLGGSPAAQSAQSHPPELVAIANEFRSWRTSGNEGVPDFAKRAEAQKHGVAEFKRRLEGLNISGWPVHAKVDYLVLRSEMDKLDFDLRIIREVTRNPDFYASQAITPVRRQIGGQRQQFDGAPVPYDATRSEAILKALGETAAIVAQGPKNLTEPVGGMADMAIERLKDVRKNYNEFARIVGPHMPEPQRARLSPAADAAGAALEKYREWIEANRSKMTANHAIGRAAFDWYVQRVMMMPYDSEQLLMQAEQEKNRNWAFLQLERQRNQFLQPQEPAKSMEEFAEWADATDVLSRVWAERYNLFTRPPDVGSVRAYYNPSEPGVAVYLSPFEFMSFPTRGPDGPNTKTRFLLPPDHYFSSTYFWERVQRYDPAANHPHSEYPGHFFEGIVSRRTTCDLRRGHNTRGDAWTNYFEEVQLQVDYPFVNGPRSRELLYIFAINRAERVYSAVKFADGSLTPETLERHMMKTVPYMDTFVARNHEVWRKYTAPAQVLTYQVGKTEIYKLLTDRMQQLGDEFNLKEFHDSLLATGQIPISLARWEMTGFDDEAQRFLKPAPFPASGAITSASQSGIKP
jgi:hypothetical protein